MKKLASPRSGRDAQNFAKKKIAQGAKAKKINKCFTIQYRKEKTRHKGEKKLQPDITWKSLSKQILCIYMHKMNVIYYYYYYYYYLLCIFIRSLAIQQVYFPVL